MYQRVWKERIEPYFDTYPKSKNDLISLMLNDKSFAMMDTYEERIYYDDYVSCQTINIPKMYFPAQYAYIIAKGSVYYQAFRHQLQSIKETGTLDRIKDQYKTQPQNCPDITGQALGFNQTFTAFLLFLGGLLAAMAILRYASQN